MWRLLILFFGLSSLFACKKEEHKANPLVTPTPVDTTVVKDTTWPTVTTQDLVFYEINLRSQGSNGTFAGLVNQLDSIKSLGANTVWLMPIFPVGLVRHVGALGSPYSVQDYQAVNPEFGSMAEFKELVRQAHSRRLRVVLDWVANHTSWDNAWIRAHRTWYTRNAQDSIVPPAGTNWQDVADLDFASAPMRQEMIRSMKFWVTETGIDGFRYDAANMIPDDFWKQATDSLKTIPVMRPLIFLAEGDHRTQLQNGMQINYGWDYYAQLKYVIRDGRTAITLPLVHASEYNGMPAGSQRLRFTTNHDETAWDNTPIALFGGKAGALAAQAAALGAGGVPMIYNGQEVGDPTKLPLFERSSINWSLNPDMRLAYKRMLAFYNQTPVLRYGTSRGYASADVAVFLRQQNTNQAAVLVNVRNRAATYAVPAALVGKWKTHNEDSLTLPATLSLQPFEYFFLRR